MTGDRPAPKERPLSLADVTGDIRQLSEDGLFQWLVAALDESSPESIPLPTMWARHTFLSNLYRSCDRPLQLRFANAFASLLESFEPRPGADLNDRKYLFSLLSLAATVRSTRAKERLCRWLYLELFWDWKEEFFNLHGELILATMTYDPDDRWVAYISKILPTKPFFPEVASRAYRALLQTKGADALNLLPEVLRSIDADREEGRDKFGYLLELTLDRVGPDVFRSRTAAALKAESVGVAGAFAAVQKLERCLAAAMPGRGDELGELIDYLDAQVWQPAVEVWYAMGEDDNLRAFEEVLETCEYTVVPHNFVKNALGILTFGGKHHLVVPRRLNHLGPFFGHYERNYEEANRPAAARAAGAGGQG